MRRPPASRPVLTSIAVTAALLALADIVMGSAYAIAVGVSARPAAELVGDIVITGSFAAVGLLLAVRRPQLPIGWLFLLAAVAWSVSCLTVWPHHLVATHAAVPTAPAAIASADAQWAWPLSVVPSIQLPLLLLPDGRLPDRRWRPVVPLTLVAMVVTSASLAVVPTTLSGYDRVRNPFAVPALTTAANALSLLGSVTLLAVAVAAVTRLVRVYRRAGGLARQQLRWVAVGGIAAVLGIVLTSATTNTPIAGLLTLIGLCLVPVTMGVAVLRYRLYDLGRLVSRTVSYALVTGVLVAVYAAVVTLAGLVAAGRPIGVAAGTLVAAALFRPLRRRLQLLVDRRFDRTRYDRAATVEAFSNRLRAGVDLGIVRDDLVDVVGRTLAPSSVSLWTPPAAVPLDAAR